MEKTKMSSKHDNSYGGKITNRLDALLEGAAPKDKATNSIPLEQIQLPSAQPRRYFDTQAMQDLVASVKQHGILQPLLVRPLDEGKYELVAGERRYRAAKEVGLTEVPVVVRSLSNSDALQIALIENLQREDLNPIEQTEGILHLLAIKLEKTVEAVPPLLHRLQHSQKVADPKVSNNVIGKNEADGAEDETLSRVNPDIQIVEEVFTGLGGMTWESFINNRLPILNLPEDILNVLRQGQIAYTKAKALAQVKDDPQRSALLKSAIDNNLSLSQIKEQVKASQLQLAKKSTVVSTDLSERFTTVTRKLKKSPIWSDTEKRQQLEAVAYHLGKSMQI